MAELVVKRCPRCGGALLCMVDATTGECMCGARVTIDGDTVTLVEEAARGWRSHHKATHPSRGGILTGRSDPRVRMHVSAAVAAADGIEQREDRDGRRH